MVNGKTMISLASSLTSTAQSSVAQPVKGAAADAAGAAQAFPEALAAQAGKLNPGTALPISLGSGKTLPVLAGATLAGSADETGTDPVRDDVAEGEPVKAEGEAAPAPGNAVQPLAVLVQLVLPAPEGATPSQPASGAAARKSPAHVFAAATPPKGSPIGQNSLLPQAAPQQSPVGQASTPSVTVHVAAPTEAPADDRAATGPGKEPRAVKKDTPVVAESSIGAASARVEASLPAPAAVPSTPLDPLVHRAHGDGKAPSPVAALHDLTSVVDRLVAAREALAPATAAITLRHGELGDLSLRFDQHRDGHLAVQLSASDPDAQRAIVAAVSDAGFRGTADGQAGTSQQPAQSQAQARGHSAERDSGNTGHGSATRQDQPQQRRPATHGQERPGDDRRRAGVFA